MKKIVKYILLAGVLTVGTGLYSINNASAHQMNMTPYQYQHYKAPAQAVQADITTVAEENNNQNGNNQNQNNNQPPYPAYPPYMMRGPGMMGNNPYYGPNSNNQQQPPAYNYAPNGMGMGMMRGWCW